MEAAVNNVTSHNCHIFRRPGGLVIFGPSFFLIAVNISVHSRNDRQNITVLGIFVCAKVSSSANVVDNCSMGSDGLTMYLMFDLSMFSPIIMGSSIAR